MTVAKPLTVLTWCLPGGAIPAGKPAAERVSSRELLELTLHARPRDPLAGRAHRQARDDIQLQGAQRSRLPGQSGVQDENRPASALLLTCPMSLDQEREGCIAADALRKEYGASRLKSALTVAASGRGCASPRPAPS